MPAFAKISLVSSVFHPADVAFVLAWSNAAVGLDGWRVELDQPGAPEEIRVIPPGADVPVFFLSRMVGEILLERRSASGERREVTHFANAREAVLALCPLDDAAVEQIHIDLEHLFPRGPGR